MLAVLRAFAWMRWRMLVNSLEHSGARDTVQRFSLAIEGLGPIMAAVLMVPSAIGLAGLGAAAGYALAGGQAETVLLKVLGFGFLAATFLAIVGPLFLPAADRTNPVRILLLPIPRGTMYVAQTAAAFGDPWIALLVPPLLAVPIGLAAGGAPVAAALTLAGGVLLLIVMLGIASLGANLIHLAVRDRRRGEILALVVILILPMLGMIPAMMNAANSRDAEGRRVPRAERRREAPGWLEQAGARAFAFTPSQLYVRTTRDASRGEPVAAATAGIALGATALLLHALSFFTFNKLLDAPGSTGARRAVPTRAVWGRTLPLLSPAASAVALAHLRLATRTTRGRSIMVSPLLVVVVFGFLMIRGGGNMDFGPFQFESGIGLAAFAAAAAILSIAPLTMNQFAVDRAGLTLALLSPISDRDYLSGKSVGNALIAAIPAGVGIAVAAAAFPGGSLALWLCLPLAIVSVLLITAPMAAILSAVFPRVVDLNSIGRKSNAHGIAGLVGLLTSAVAAVPCVLLIMLATRWLQQPLLAPVLLAVWCGVAYAIYRTGVHVALKVFAQRRENFALLT